MQLWCSIYIGVMKTYSREFQSLWPAACRELGDIHCLSRLAEDLTSCLPYAESIGIFPKLGSKERHILSDGNGLGMRDSLT